MPNRSLLTEMLVFRSCEDALITVCPWSLTRGWLVELVYWTSALTSVEDSVTVCDVTVWFVPRKVVSETPCK